MSAYERGPARAASESPAKVTNSILGRAPDTNETHSIADLSAVQEWIERVYGDAPGVLVVNHRDAEGIFRGTGGGCVDTTAVVERVRRLDADRAESIYLRVSTLKHMPADGLRGAASDSFVLPGLWADVDFGRIGHKHDLAVHRCGLELPPNAREARRIVMESGLPAPTLWVNSGGGLYPWWLFESLVEIDDSNRQQLADLLANWQRALGWSASRMGYCYGTGVGDIARVLRLPGTVNRKEGQARPCRVIEDSGPEYSVEELQTALTRVSPPQEIELRPVVDTPPSDKAGESSDSYGVFGVLDEHVSFAKLLSGADWRKCTRKHPRSISQCFTRPGEPANPCSAHVLADYPAVLVNWSKSSGLPVGMGQRLTKARVFAYLAHDGDESAAAKDLLAAMQGHACSTVAEGLSLPKLQSAIAAKTQDSSGSPHIGGDTETDARNRHPSVADRLVHLATSRFEFGISDQGEPFAVPKTGAHIVRMLRGDASLRAELARAYFQEHGKAASQSALADALMVCEGLAREMSPLPLALRVARTGGVTWVDLGEVKGRAVRIDNCGWSVVERAPMLFDRTVLTGVMPEPEDGGSIDELWNLLNVSPRYRPIVIAVLVSALIPDIPHPVVLLSGEQGSGKSTATKILVSLLDPSPAPLRKPPRDEEQWVVAAAGSWVVALDNLSDLKDWLSDALCRASTGDGDVRRRLYTDNGLFVFSFKRVVFLNGIDLTDIRGDLTERLVAVRLENIPESERKEETALWKRWADAHPRILGALFDLAAKVFDAMANAEHVELPRMADFARVQAAVDYVLGTDGLAVYRELGSEMATDTVTSDLVLTAVVERITESWMGNARKLLSTIDPDDAHYGHPGWPATPREMTAVMRRRAPSLRGLGWEVVELPRGGRDKSSGLSISLPRAAWLIRGSASRAMAGLRMVGRGCRGGSVAPSRRAV
jgi:hypothetical protein